MSEHHHHHAPAPARPPVSLYAFGALERLALAGLLAGLMWLAVWLAIG